MAIFWSEGYWRVNENPGGSSLSNDFTSCGHNRNTNLATLRVGVDRDGTTIPIERCGDDYRRIFGPDGFVAGKSVGPQSRQTEKAVAEIGVLARISASKITIRYYHGAIVPRCHKSKYPASIIVPRLVALRHSYAIDSFL